MTNNLYKGLTKNHIMVLKDYMKFLDEEIKKDALKGIPYSESYYYWSKMHMLESKDLSYQDWKEIRTGDYWEIKDTLLKKMEKKRFTVMRIRQWRGKQ